jgi:hypothetical protein
MEVSLMKHWIALVVALALTPSLSLAAADQWRFAPEKLPVYLRDRGQDVIPTSMFGTYVKPGELLIYPFFEHYKDGNFEYSPQELGHGLDADFRGTYEANEALIFLGYGLTRTLSLEFEAAAIQAELERSPDDTTTVPEEVNERGLGDVQTQLNWLWHRETSSRPAAYSYFEVVFPLQKDRVLTGTSDWEFKLGTGVIRGSKWGTFSARAAVEYDRSEEAVELGEIALEYLKRLSPMWRLYTGLEGAQDEWELITELQLFLGNYVFVKLNSAVGLTSKATDWAPELGIVFRVPLAVKRFQSDATH